MLQKLTLPCLPSKPASMETPKYKMEVKIKVKGASHTERE